MEVLSIVLHAEYLVTAYEDLIPHLVNDVSAVSTRVACHIKLIVPQSVAKATNNGVVQLEEPFRPCTPGVHLAVVEWGLWERQREARVLSVVREKRGLPGSGVRGIVVREFDHRNNVCPRDRSWQPTIDDGPNEFSACVDGTCRPIPGVRPSQNEL